MRELLVIAAVSTPFLLGASLAADRDGDVLFRFSDPAIVESSGLVVVDGLVVTMNDSGDVARVFTVDPETGKTVGVTGWAGTPEDLEALAPAGEGAVWAGDIGDNQRNRDSVTVTRVPVGRGTRIADVQSYELKLPRPEDAETLLADPATGRLHLVTKSISGGVFYAAPRELDPNGPNRLEAVGQVAGLVTDGAFFPDGRHLVLRNYTTAFVYTFPGLDLVDSFGLPAQRQGEGIAVRPDGRILVSSEGPESPVFQVRLPDGVRAAMAGGDDADATPGDLPQGPQAGDETEADAGDETGQRSWWPWVAGAGVAMVSVVVLLRARRSR